ncbi:MAG: hypothetical protein P8M22_11440 [Phycisphaerales bacterium]|nr:hypothetical protein [Phycisphaerales bacterium]
MSVGCIACGTTRLGPDKTFQRGIPPIVAIFRKKQDDGAAQEAVEQFKPDPEKARKWFEHAKAMADSHQWGSALVYYAHGLKLDPESISAQEQMLDAAQRYYKTGGKKLPSKDIKQLDGPGPMDKLAVALVTWTSELDKPALAIKALDAAVKAEQFGLGGYLCPRILVIMRRARKVNRNHLLQLKSLAAECDDWDVAIAAGTAALEMDSSDSKLDDELKDLAAQRAMAKGGYEKAAGKEGGFREFIKDADKQQELSQQDSLAGAGGSRQSGLERARHAYETSPEVPDVLNKYAQLLRREGSDSALEEAERVYHAGYKSTGEYRFRMNAGDIAINRHRSAIEILRQDLESAGDHERAAMQERLDQKEKELLEIEAGEYADRSIKYPTDRGLKYQLGDVAFRRGDLGTAMECFQKAKDEPKLRTIAGHYLGRCFALEEWHSEAIAEYQEVLSNIDATDKEREMDIRYDLMVSMISSARSDSNGEQARDALEICSWIARKDITYKDIRDRRKEIDQLVRELG